MHTIGGGRREREKGGGRKERKKIQELEQLEESPGSAYPLLAASTEVSAWGEGLLGVAR